MQSSEIKINLMFEANTTNVINNISQLNSLLNQISRNTVIGIDGGSLSQASQAAKELQIQLQNAVNVDTGKLDLTKLSSNLKKAGTDLRTLTTQIQAVGPVGEQAFLKMATAVASAEAPIFKLNGRLKDCITTFANTAKWQIASTAIHGIQSILEDTVRHAEELNGALNDIRIVTGLSENEMDKFAKKASDAAKQLSTTTTEYSKAALIFYQQGLTGDAVTDRADVVVKLSQVTGQSAEAVSDQMTAIWNNFDDGSQSLEYYADVLTKLGAATAADTEEITQGLSKFAAVADTVGLSYETAAASVATVVDKTKQSAEVVGTSFKTIFARMQGLKLGDTLEDGVDLNKYSEALSSVGVNVLNAKGEMREMDDILNELGEKWQGFGSTTQTAIAQTVGGIRQYNQMMALMNNWDSVKANIDIAKEASGELMDQQKIWATSYEASAERIQQAKNELYESFISDDSLITFNNIIAELIGGITSAIENFGGIVPVILTVVGLFSKTFFPIIMTGLRQVGNAFSVWSGKAANDVAKIQASMTTDMTAALNKGGLLDGVRQQMEITQKLLQIKRQVTLASKHMTAAQQEELKGHLDLYEIMVTETKQLLEKKAALEATTKSAQENLNMNATYKQRSGMASKKVLDNFKSEATDQYNSEEMGDISEQVTSTTKTATSSEIEELKNKKAQLVSDRESKQQQLAVERQRAQSHLAVLQDKEINNTSSGIDTEDGMEHFEKWTEASDKVNQLEAELNDTTGAYQAQVDAIDAQIQKLEVVKKLQEEIHEIAIKESATDISAGETNVQLFSNQDDLKPAEMERSMMSDTVKDLGGTMSMGEDNEIGTISVDASLSNLEALFTKMGEYKIQLSEIEAVQTDLNNVLPASSEAYNALMQAIDAGAYSTEEFAAAERELSSISKEVESANKKVAEAEKKLNAEQNKEKQDSKALKNARKQLSQAAKEAAATELKYQKTLKKQPKVFKDIIKAQKPVLNSKNKFLDLAKSAGASEKEIQELSKAFDLFKKTGDPSHLAKVKTTLQDMGTATSGTISNLDSLAGEMRELMLNAGMSDEEIDPIIQKFRELASLAPQVKTQMDGVNGEFDEMQGRLNISAEGIGNAVQGLASFVGQMSMASSGIQTLIGAFDSSASPMETFMGILTGASMLLPVIAVMIKNIANAKKQDTIASIQQTVAEAKLAVAKGASTVATWAQTAAEVALKIAQNPVFGAVVLGLVIAAGAAMAIYTNNTNKAAEAAQKKADAEKEQSEQVKELAGAWQEQSSTLDGIISQYKELEQTGESVKELQEELANSAKEVTQAYTDLTTVLSGLSNKEFKDMQGNVITYTEAVEKLREAMLAGNVEATEYYKNQLNNAISTETAEETKKTAESAKGRVANKIVEAGDASYKDDKVTRRVGGTGAGETEAIDILNEVGVGGNKQNNYTYDIALDASSSKSFLDDYEKLLEAQKRMENELGDDLDNSDTYREISEMIDNSKEAYEELKAAQSEADKYAVVDVAEKLKTSAKFKDSKESMDVTNINSLKEYEEYRNKILSDSSIKDDPAAEQAASDWLAAQGNLEQYEKIRAKIANVKDMTGIDLTNVYNSLDEDEKKLFLEVDFNKHQSKEAIEKEIERLQEEADKADRVKIAEELDLEADELETYTNLLMAQNKEMRSSYKTAKQFEEAMTKIAVANKRMEKGVKTIADGWEDFDKIMSDSNSTIEDVSTILPDINAGLQDMLNLSDEEFELLPADFAKKNWKLIQDVINGVEGSVDTLRDAAGKDILLNITGAVDADGKIKSELQTIHDSIVTMDDAKFTVGVALDPEDHAKFIQSCESMINTAGMTAEQAQAYFASMGYDVELEEVTPKNTTTTNYSYYKLDPEATEKAGGVPQFSDKATDIPVTTQASTTAYAIKTITPNGSYGGNVAVNKTAPTTATEGAKKDSGSKSEPKKAEKVKKSDVVERYREIDDSLDDLRDTMEDVNKATDRLYGASRINQMKKANSMILDEIDLLKEKRRQAEANLKIDRAELNRAASQAGVGLTYDYNGNISNYTGAMEGLYAQLNSAINSANADGNADDDENKIIDNIQEKIDELKSAMDQYNDTRELIEDLDNELDDKFYEWQDNNAEILSYELEIKIELKDNELKRLEYYLGKIEDDFYSRAEAAALMGDQMKIHSESLGTYQSHLEKLDAQYANNEISQADYIEGLNTLTDGLYTNLEALNELDKQMMHYYEDTLAQGAEEIGKVTSQLEHQTSILDHYLTLIELMGKSTDYEKVGVVLEGQAETTKNEMIAAREEYELYAKRADEMYLLWQSAENEAQAELYKKQYDAALEASQNAQETYLSKAEAYAEKLRAILENSLSKYAQDLENALTGGSSFDQMNTKMERQQSLQEEYLTTTNKIYETNKLMNQVQQQIDKTTNTVAKQRLKSFIAETNELQKKNKLSKYELEIQQAKYEILLAEIALEEAQDAKSQVRLQRDTEGNFGYVYTADQDKIAQAQQKLADTQNNLYNIALEGANGYAEKYYQTLNELYDTLADIQQQYLEGAFESEEEYHNAMAAAKEYYYELLENYSDLYTVAISTDARVLEDSWSREFGSMTYNTEMWKSQVEGYVENVVDAFKDWDDQMDTIAGQYGLGGDLKNLSSGVKDITNESKNLITLLTKTGGLFDTIDKEITAVGDLTGAYAKQREELQKEIKLYEDLIDAIMTKNQVEAGITAAKNITPSGQGGGSNGSGGGGGSGGGSKDGKLSIGEKVKLKYSGRIYHYDSYGAGPTGDRGTKGDVVTIQNLVNGGKGTTSQPYGVAVKSSNSAYGWLKIGDIEGFNTGGYTGKWGSYGKLALLHEKELVLNANETENLLTSMELLNNIVSTIDLHAINSQFGGLLKSPAFRNINSTDTLEQNVTIEANFPGVSSRTEIEEAFSTLVNRASQYANRK